MEIAFASLTREELLEAGDYIESLRRHFKLSPTIDHGHVAATQGPSVVLDGLQLAFMREAVARFGGPEWYAGMPTDGHEAKGLLDLLLERMTLNPDRRLVRGARDRAKGLDKLCASCQIRYPLTEEHWERVTPSMLSATCRGCLAGARARRDPFPNAPTPETEEVFA